MKIGQTVQKLQLFIEIQNGGRQPSWISWWRHFWTCGLVEHDVIMLWWKFGGNRSNGSKVIAFWKIQDGGRRPFCFLWWRHFWAYGRVAHGVVVLQLKFGEDRSSGSKVMLICGFYMGISQF